MKNITILLSLLFIFSCSCNPESVEKKCDVDNRWIYQSEKFDEVEMPYLFIDQYVENPDDPKLIQEIAIVDLKKREVIKTISFSEPMSGSILRNSNNGKFYFTGGGNYPGKAKYGLFEINPKTGVIKQVSDTHPSARVEAIDDNGRVYSVTNGGCKNEEVSDIFGTEITVYNPETSIEKIICVPSMVNHIFKNHNGKIYTRGDDSGAYIFEIDPSDDSVKNILPKTDKTGGWTVISMMGNQLYLLIDAVMSDVKNHILVIDLDDPTYELKEIPFKLGDFTDYNTYSPSVGGWQVGDDLFVFTYNRLHDYSKLVKYNTVTKKGTWLYDQTVNEFISFYDKENNTVEMVPGVIFFMSDYAIKQFRGDGYKVPEPIRKFCKETSDCNDGYYCNNLDVCIK